MAWIAVGFGAVSVVGSLFGSSAAAKQRNEQIEQQRLAAKYKYYATESSINIMKASSREESKNAISEVLRVGAESSRNIEASVNQKAGKSLASSEGLTSGRSKGLEMVSLYIQGNKAIQDSKNKVTGAINQIVDTQDKYTNDLNNKLISAHDEMASILAGSSPSINSGAQAITAGIQGVAQGYSLGASTGAYDTTIKV